jgi:VWFA-related protein
VPQVVEAVSAEALPINVTLLLDTSGSIGGMLPSLTAQVGEAVALLRDEDRVRVIVFAADTRQVVPLQSPRAALTLGGTSGGAGGTSLHDAFATALVRRRAPDRGELVVAFSDGIDTTSTMNEERLLEVARRSEAVLHAAIVRSPQLVAACVRPDESAQPWLCDTSGLSAVAAVTGGRLYTFSPGRHVPEGLRQALDDFRTSYTLRYTRTGAPSAGWHDISVTLARPGAFTVRARRGYFAQ